MGGESAGKSRKKVGGRTYQRYSQETLQEAIRRVKAGEMSQREAAKEYQIPRSTIINKLGKKHMKSSFRQDEEDVGESEEEEFMEEGHPEEQQSEGPAPSRNSIQVGDFVEFLYEGRVYRGEVVAVADDGPKIRAMEQFGNRFKWPRHDDILTYSFSDVIRKLQPPIPVGTRGQLTFIK